jgi:hypothetical protein
METILSYESEYSRKYPNLYPLIYFDAIWVIFSKLLEIYTNSQKNELKNNIFNCVFVYYSFGKAAIFVENEDGAALATSKLKQCYDNSIEQKVSDIEGDIAELLIELGGYAADKSKKLVGKSFLNCKLEDYIIECLRERGIPNSRNLNKVVLDIALPGKGDYDARWNYVKKLGGVLQTNFDMNFDWRTGKSLKG